jgi:hypothetical protein
VRVGLGFERGEADGSYADAVRLSAGVLQTPRLGGAARPFSRGECTCPLSLRAYSFWFWEATEVEKRPEDRPSRTICGMEPVELGLAKEQLDALAWRSRELVAGSLILAVAAFLAAWTVGPQLALSLACGAAVGLAFSYLAHSERSSLLTRLVSQGDTVRVGEAKAHARKLAAPSMRLRLARGLDCAAAAGRPGLHEYTWVIPERAFDFYAELQRLAAAFRDMTVPVTPTSAALCRRMLCEAATSPLYNRNIPKIELARLLQAIRAGIDSRSP